MRSLFWLIAFAFLTSCIANKKVVYLQKDDVNKKELPKDTVLRTYDAKAFEYRIQPHDALYVRFQTSASTDEEFNFLSPGQSSNNINNNPNGAVLNSELVDENGDITFPVVGKVRVSGLTIFEIQEKLQQLADQHLPNASVKVRLVNFRFTLIGELLREGQVTTMNNRTTITEAIGLAGGLSELADRSNVKIIRMRNGVSEVGYVDLLDENIINSPYYYMNQNDVLIVPPLRQRPFRKYFGQNLSLFISSISVLLLVINLSR
jgi:polysaccharide export outer membrane protein